MKHNKEVDEFYKFLDRMERDPVLRDKLEQKDADNYAEGQPGYKKAEIIPVT